MGSMKGKQEKIDAAFGRLADMIQSGHLLASADPVGFLDTVAAELKDLRAENVKLKGTVSIKLDRVNDLEKALQNGETVTFDFEGMSQFVLYLLEQRNMTKIEE